jgi:hypothetical protein
MDESMKDGWMMHGVWMNGESMMDACKMDDINNVDE